MPSGRSQDKPLNKTAVADLLYMQVGERPAWDVVEEIHFASLGNPEGVVACVSQFSVEQITGKDLLPSPLPVPASWKQLLLSELQELPKATQTLLLIVALDSTEGGKRFFSAAHRNSLPLITSLERAEAKGIIAIKEAAAVFIQPFMREMVIHSASFRDRRIVHLTLAELFERDGETAKAIWHRSQAVLGTDEQLATQLEVAATESSMAVGEACKFLQKSVEISEDPARKAHRAALAANAAALAGWGNRSLILTGAATNNLNASLPTRADAVFVRGRVFASRGQASLAIEELIRAGGLYLEVGDTQMTTSAYLLASQVAFVMGNLHQAARLLQKAARLPPGIEERIPYEFGFAIEVPGQVAHDAAARVPMLGEAVATASDRSDVNSLMLAIRMTHAYGDSKSALRFTERGLSLARKESAVGAIPELLMNFVFCGREIDRVGILEEDAKEALRWAEQFGQQDIELRALVGLSWVTSVQGRTEECLGYIERGTVEAEKLRLPFYSGVLRWCSAILDMGFGRFDQAYEKLAMLQQKNTTFHSLVALWSTPDFVEVALRCRGSMGEVEEAFTNYSSWVDRNRPPLALAQREHCRGLLLDALDAAEAFENAIKLHEGRRWILSARTHLAYGEMLRRNRRRSDSRAHLRIALEIFETLGATPWADKAKRELRASGEGTVKLAGELEVDLRDLTPQELQIAQLVGSGLTNREVGAQLFLSHRTVEYHLHKMFAKLGVASRSELVRMVTRTTDLTDTINNN